MYPLNRAPEGMVFPVSGNLHSTEERLLGVVQPGRRYSFKEISELVDRDVSRLMVREAIWELVDQGKLCLTPDRQIVRSK